MPPSSRFAVRGCDATTVEQLCVHAGVAKGAFFHHFASKEALAIAAADLGRHHRCHVRHRHFHDASGPVERIMAYLDLHALMISGDPAEFSCLAGTMVQEAFATAPDVRDACAAAILGHAATLEADLDAALDRLDPPPSGVTGASLARFTQTVLQGSFIMSKAADDPQLLLEGIDHLRRYLTVLLTLQTSPSITTQGAHP